MVLAVPPHLVPAHDRRHAPIADELVPQLRDAVVVQCPGHRHVGIRGRRRPRPDEMPVDLEVGRPRELETENFELTKNLGPRSAQRR